MGVTFDILINKPLLHNHKVADISDYTAGASRALDNLASVAINTSLLPNVTATIDLGSSSKYWSNIYVGKIYLNATATLDGSTGGRVALTGNFQASGHSSFGSLQTPGTNDIVSVGETQAVSGGVDVHGIVVNNNYNSSYATGGLYGLFFQPYLNHTTGTSNFIAGAYGGSRLTGNGSVSSAYGVYTAVDNTSGGTITTAIASFALINNTGAGTISNAYGLYIQTPVNSGGGAITTSHGLYIADQNVGTTKYAIYTNAGTVRFGDSVNIATTKTLTTDIIATNATNVNLQILPNGSGKIGLGATAPLAMVDIKSGNDATAGLSANGNYHLRLTSDVTTNGQGTGISFQRTTADAVGASIVHVRQGANSYGDLFFATRPNGGNVTERLRIDSAGNVVIGTGALSTSATDGFLYIPTSAGAPTGVPTTKTGMVALEYNTTNNNLYVYNGAWKKVALA